MRIYNIARMSTRLFIFVLGEFLSKLVCGFSNKIS
jgi:hypothetical protein